MCFLGFILFDPFIYTLLFVMCRLCAFQNVATLIINFWQLGLHWIIFFSINFKLKLINPALWNTVCIAALKDCFPISQGKVSGLKADICVLVSASSWELSWLIISPILQRH